MPCAVPLFEKLESFCAMVKKGRGGVRARAGRKANGKNRATIEKELLAARILDEASMRGRKLGKERLEEFMEMFGGLAGAFQPQPSVPGQAVSQLDLETWAKSPREPIFEKYAKLALKAAGMLAEYQSPRFAPVQVAAPPPPPGGPIRKKFTVGIFDGQGRKAPRHITVKPTSSVTAPAKLN